MDQQFPKPFCYTSGQRSFQRTLTIAGRLPTAARVKHAENNEQRQQLQSDAPAHELLGAGRRALSAAKHIDKARDDDERHRRDGDNDQQI